MLFGTRDVSDHDGLGEASGLYFFYFAGMKRQVIGYGSRIIMKSESTRDERLRV
ncbi:MAG: hypothetical protein H6766_02630 [Candidatus Peribacteria bacterium]|nr:MAG: hypothetical protein H6766_02630 [Candidatus Peribacteria bacterium]